ncbi:MAG: hypothetical protein IJC43_06185, partial [Clostridia bacterium]|nr:hypothetical protein [Clostridia bacterium]
MEPIAPLARTKADMSVLRKDILPVSPFAVLSQAFHEQIMGRFESRKGFFPMVSLEYLYPEEAAEEETAAGEVHLDVSLKLILQQLKESGSDPAAERILKKVETLHLARLEKEGITLRQPPAARPARTTRPSTHVGRPSASRPEVLRPPAYGQTAGQGSPALPTRPMFGRTERPGRAPERPGSLTASASPAHLSRPGVQPAPAAAATPTAGTAFPRPAAHGSVQSGDAAPAATLLGAADGRSSPRAASAPLPSTTPAAPLQSRGIDPAFPHLPTAQPSSASLSTDRPRAATAITPPVAGEDLRGLWGRPPAQISHLTPQEDTPAVPAESPRPTPEMLRRMEQAATRAAAALAGALPPLPQQPLTQDPGRTTAQPVPPRPEPTAQ